MVEKLYENSKISSSYIGKIGNNKAYVIDFQFGEHYFCKRFYIVNLNGVTTVELDYPKNVDIDSLKEYKSFVNSFKSKGKSPTWFNHFIFGIIGPNLIRLLIIFVIVGVSTFIKKLKSWNIFYIHVTKK